MPPKNQSKKKTPVQTSRKIVMEDIDVIQNLIERGIQAGLTKKYIVRLLAFEYDPRLTCFVWEKLKSGNKEFFKAYYASHYLLGQVLRRKRLQKQYLQNLSTSPASGSNVTSMSSDLLNRTRQAASKFYLGGMPTSSQSYMQHYAIPYSCYKNQENPVNNDLLDRTRQEASKFYLGGMPTSSQSYMQHNAIPYSCYKNQENPVNNQGHIDGKLNDLYQVESIQNMQASSCMVSNVSFINMESSTQEIKSGAPKKSDKETSNEANKHSTSVLSLLPGLSEMKDFLNQEPEDCFSSTELEGAIDDSWMEVINVDAFSQLETNYQPVQYVNVDQLNENSAICRPTK